MGYIRLWLPQFWSAGASEAPVLRSSVVALVRQSGITAEGGRSRFGSLGAPFRPRQSAVAAALCRSTLRSKTASGDGSAKPATEDGRIPKLPRVAYPADSSVG